MYGVLQQVVFTHFYIKYSVHPYFLTVLYVLTDRGTQRYYNVLQVCWTSQVLFRVRLVDRIPVKDGVQGG